MKLYNEASTTRDPLQPIVFDADKIYNTEQTINNAPGKNPFVYPAVDWLDMLFRKSSTTQRANLSINGGGDIERVGMLAAQGNLGAAPRHFRLLAFLREIAHLEAHRDQRRFRKRFGGRVFI